MADAFHFLRPVWLVALPLGLAAILYLFRMQAVGGAWRAVVDRPLQPLVLTGGDRYAGRRWPLLLACAAWVLATLALAGPTWERLPVPAYRSSEALVVAVDLSRSMDASDLAPSRLTRAKLKLLSLLERREGGQTGLVVFSAHAFTVTPLTTDTRTIASLVGALSSDIMPSRGSRVEAGLEKAAELLRQAGAADGRILLITDGVSPEAVDVAQRLHDDGFEINVLAVGTEEGGPIPEPRGGFLTDGRGTVVIPKTDYAALQRVARAGGGRFSALTVDDADLERLEPPQAAGSLLTQDEASGEPDSEQSAEVWRDAGATLALLLLPLVALGFRRGWVAAVACAVLIPMPDANAQSSSAAAGDAPGVTRPAGDNDADGAPGGDGALGAVTDFWQGLWRRADQRGAAELDAGRPERAARLFEDPRWRAAAQYRAGDYEQAATSLAGFETPEAHYNRGNALARAGEIEPAIAEYDRALELDPEHEDARYNKALLEQLRDENPEQQASASGQNDESQSGESEAGEQDPREQSATGETDPQNARGSQTPSAGDQPGEPSSEQSGEQGEPDERLARAGDDAADSTGDGGETQDADGEQDTDSQSGDDPREGDSAGETASRDDLEQWASEQAAEQWLRRINQDPGGLLRRKFLYQYQRLGVDQDGNYVWSADDEEPW